MYCLQLAERVAENPTIRHYRQYRTLSPILSREPPPGRLLLGRNHWAEFTTGVLIPSLTVGTFAIFMTKKIICHLNCFVSLFTIILLC